MAIEQLLVPEVSGDQSVRNISRTVNEVPGVRMVVVNLADKSVRIEHDGRANLETLIQAINDAGYEQVAVLA
ncbi:MAG TPA: heavy metal-associated domain-containing protein [Kouleothrix sp.]|uniref:heavy-metal-associated domain-containing protein n=1 Tax=Kouleothrix sp. TaxID=2779161 RepID=UPI002C24FB81|nr:heavy metal-associated domain-containing protein [Kouleothrix sp.]HRC75917.1 heavy metal-associated domain-containing protein [Kouleothrix sp.]